MNKRNKALLLSVFFLSWSSVSGLGQEKKQLNAPPQISGIPDITLDQNSKAEHAVDLWKYATDPDTPVSEILFSVTSSREFYWEGSARVKVNENRYIDIDPDQNWVGEEEIVVEANDGTNMAYDTFKIVVRSTEAGQLIEAEDTAQVERKGSWIEVPQATAKWVQSNHPGDSLRSKFKGSFVTVLLWGGRLNILQRYYESPNYEVLFEAWKTYEPGIADIEIDGKCLPEIDLARTDKKGWNEYLVASGLEPRDHELEIVVKAGFLCVDKIRVSSDPLSQMEISTSDDYQTPLADIVFRFTQNGVLKTILRSTPDGRVPTFFGLREGIYDLSVEPDSNPGYTLSKNVDERLLPQKIEKVEIKTGPSRPFHFALKYESREDRSLQTIRRPIGTIPFILRKGDILPIECKGSMTPLKVSAFLFDDDRRQELKVESSEYGTQMIMNQLNSGVLVKARIPEDIAEGLYTLRIVLDGQEDSAQRAVKIVSDFKNSYRFVHLGDLHIQGTKDSREHDEKLKAIAEEIKLFSPEFAIMTGDIADCGTRPEYLRFVHDLSSFNVPTYVIPGNHDHYYGFSKYSYFGFDEYEKYVGQKFYSFAYGDDYFIGVDTGDYEKIYETSLEGIHASQWPWLIRELDGQKGRPGGLLCVFAHYDHTQGVPEAYHCTDQLLSLFNLYPVNLYLWGHGHSNLEKETGNFRTLIVETGSTIQGTYRVIEIENSKVVGSPVFEAGKLKLKHEGKNDGSESEARASIRNEMERALKDLRIKFVLKNTGKNYRADKGKIVETTLSGDRQKIAVVVSLNIAPLTEDTVRVFESGQK